MSNAPKEPSQDVLDYIKTHFSYRDGMIDGMMKQDIGSLHKRGGSNKTYKRITFVVSGEKYRIYRSHMVWFLCTGNWPVMELDHTDRNSLNDKFDNLMMATSKERQRNKDKYRYGLEIEKLKSGRFKAKSRVLKVYLGNYVSREAAKEAIEKYLEDRGLVIGGKAVEE